MPRSAIIKADNRGVRSVGWLASTTCTEQNVRRRLAAGASHQFRLVRAEKIFAKSMPIGRMFGLLTMFDEFI